MFILGLIVGLALGFVTCSVLIAILAGNEGRYEDG